MCVTCIVATDHLVLVAIRALIRLVRESTVQYAIHVAVEG